MPKGTKYIILQTKLNGRRALKNDKDIKKYNTTGVDKARELYHNNANNTSQSIFQEMLITETIKSVCEKINKIQ